MQMSEDAIYNAYWKGEHEGIAQQWDDTGL